MTKKTNPYIGDILDNTMAKVQAVVVLFSPDDEARLRAEFLTRSDGPSEKKLRGQPRPNVLFEAGLALGRHPIGLSFCADSTSTQSHVRQPEPG